MGGEGVYIVANVNMMSSYTAKYFLPNNVEGGGKDGIAAPATGSPVEPSSLHCRHLQRWPRHVQPQLQMSHRALPCQHVRLP